MATPKPLDEVAQQLGVKPRTMWNLVRTLELTKYKMPGRGKRTYLDPDEVRRKMSKPLQP